MRSNIRRALLHAEDMALCGTWREFMVASIAFVKSLDQRPRSPRRIKVAQRRIAAGRSILGKRGAR
jgi:hypothetical protein